MTELLDNVSEQIDDFSLIERLDLQDRNDTKEGLDYQEVLLTLASIFRRKDLAYKIAYTRPDQPDFRLRSDNPPEDDVKHRKLSFSEPGRFLELKVENPGNENLNGLLSELRILEELEDESDELTREPELNLLVSRTFQAELYSEYQRWKRYDSALLVAGIELGEEQDWRPAARACKHVTQTQDMIGLINQSRLGLFFPSVEESEDKREKLVEQISGHYDSDEFDLFFYQIPSDITDWNTLKNNIFDPFSLTEAGV